MIPLALRAAFCRPPWRPSLKRLIGPALPLIHRKMSTETTRAACERCRSHKLKCERPHPPTPGGTLPRCIRCTRLDAECNTGQQAKLGRPRTLYMPGEPSVPAVSNQPQATHANYEAIRPLFGPAAGQPGSSSQGSSSSNRFAQSSTSWADNLQGLFQLSTRFNSIVNNQDESTHQQQQTIMAGLEASQRLIDILGIAVAHLTSSDLQNGPSSNDRQLVLAQASSCFLLQTRLWHRALATIVWRIQSMPGNWSAATSMLPGIPSAQMDQSMAKPQLRLFAEFCVRVTRTVHEQLGNILVLNQRARVLEDVSALSTHHDQCLATIIHCHDNLAQRLGS